MAIKTKIRKHGDAAIITIQMAVLRMANLDIGQEVSLLIGDGRLILEPVRRRRLTMAELLKGSDVIKRLTGETIWARENGAAVGDEID